MIFHVGSDSMSKSKLTQKYERLLISYLYHKNIYCNEVVLHPYNYFYGNEIVDFLSLERNQEFTCYEIKVSLRDFHSKNGKNFYGNYNYYVMPRELYNKVKNEIPDFIGCYVEKENNDGSTTLTKVKKSIKKELIKYDATSLNSCLLGALYREATRNISSKLFNGIYVKRLSLKKLERISRNGLH